ncbi:MAG: thiamine pyrophosphate-dependent dehydrogenase E1 component subunit alpha [Armatimonadetes bacterium]|nr:thiamine pyrophosphate-dependent dehydrogenase E1 component subunit alpha [Armatimonadota bacterium]
MNCDTRSSVDKAKLLQVYRGMYLIRAFEETIYRLFLTRSMPGTIHQYNGQEAVAVGFCESLRPDDYITSTHRGHGHCLAKGAKLNEVMAEIFSKQTGCCRGMGGSMHLADFDAGILGANGIVGGGIPIATGAGLSIALRGTEQVAVCFFGEGASNTGSFHEGINMAAILNLPVIFVCENNLYQVSLHMSRAMKPRQVAHRADAYGIPGVVADGNDVLEVMQVAQEAISTARRGGGPTLVECMTYRHRGHSRFEPGNYRPKEEVAEWMERDPLKVFRSRTGGFIAEGELASIEQRIDEEMEQAVAYADASPDVDSDEFSRMVYA